MHLIYGHGGELMRERLANEKVNWVLQTEQLGTAHAVQQAAPFFKDNEDIVVLYGDAPLITKETLEKLIAAKPENGIALLTVKLDNPTGYGRIIRENGRVISIVEQKDANAEQLNIQEVNTGVMVSDGASFKKWLARVGNNNAQGEYYLTDLILVEGFKQEPIPKILLHRQEMTKPLPEIDNYVLALATNYSLETDRALLDINHIPQIADFIETWLRSQERK